MQLDLSLGYATPADRTWPADISTLARSADDLGYRCLWVAEAFGSDAPSPLAWLAGQTTRIDVGSAVMQIPGRSAAATAMTAATIDLLSGGRFRLGLGVSGPQVSEGFHGVPFEAPLRRTREYVDVVRLALDRAPITYAGRHLVLPLPDGPGKTLTLKVPRVRRQIPIYLAAVGPKNLELAGEIADGWHGVFFAPEHAVDLVAALRAGAERAGKGTPGDPLAGFDLVPSVPVAIADDVETAAAMVAPYCAFYLGGMGSREQNFYNRLAGEMGFATEAALIQDLFLSGRPREAAAAVPVEFIDRTALIGPASRVIARTARYAAAGVTTLAVSPVGTDLAGKVETLRVLARIFA